MEGAEALWPFCSGCPSSSAPVPACLKASALLSLPGYQATLRGSRSRRSLHHALHGQHGTQHRPGSPSCSRKDTAPQILVRLVIKLSANECCPGEDRPAEVPIKVCPGVQGKARDI